MVVGALYKWGLLVEQWDGGPLPRGSQERSFLHKVDFGHNMTIEVHCTTFE
jgi:hypothetical protein